MTPSLHSYLQGVQYMMFLVLTMPLVFCLLLPWICFAYLLHFLGFNFYTKTKNVSKFGVKTVLVTGAPHTKGLQVGGQALKCFIFHIPFRITKAK